MTALRMAGLGLKVEEDDDALFGKRNACHPSHVQHVIVPIAKAQASQQSTYDDNIASWHKRPCPGASEGHVLPSRRK
jgi:hypothetical protein